MDMAKWGNALQGAGAWLQGQGPQWQNAQAAKKVADAQAREAYEETTIGDMVRMRALLDRNDVGRVSSMLQERIGDESMPADFRQGYAELSRWTSEGNIQAVSDEIDLALDVAQRKGKMGNAPNNQYGGAYQVSDSEGNLFTATTMMNPTPGVENPVSVQYAPMTPGGPSQPVGRVQILKDGQTSQQRINEKVTGATATAQAASAQALDDEYAQRARGADTELMRLAEINKLSQNVRGGIPTAVKMKLAYFFPDGVDISDEAALDAALTSAALDQLAKFKGPTTDFEYGVAQSIPGTVTDPRLARQARAASLERAAWFTQEEYKQYRKFRSQAGNNHNDFRFDMNATKKTAKGEYSLQQLLDTAVANHLSIKEVLAKLNEK